MEESRGALVNNRTRLDYGRHRRGAAGASVALASAVASNEVAANGPDMDEKLSRLNARESAAVFRYYASFKALPGTRRDARALCSGALSPPPSSFLSSFLSPFYFDDIIRLCDYPNSFHN